MKILCVFGRHNYGNPARGLSYEYSNFLPAFRNLGHEVVHFESWSRAEYQNFADLNQAFLEAVESVRPDVIFCVLMHYELWLEVLENLRRNCPATLIHWGTDDSWKYEQFSRWVAAPFHVHATTAHSAMDKARRDGLTNFVSTQWAANSANFQEPLPASQCRYPVSFVGSAYGHRPRWITDLKKKGVDVECFGYGWRNGPVGSEEIPTILRGSVLSLSFADSGLHLGRQGLYRSRQIKARVFEVPGAGGCLLTQNAPHLSEYYLPDKEIATFEDPSGLAEAIRWLLANPDRRDAIARAGHARTVREHMYEQRFGELLAVAATRGTPQDRRSAGFYRFDRDWFAGLRRRHAVGEITRMAARCAVAPLSALVGARRGPRAARRLTFELSWRLSGRKTYTSAGLPGRLFYRES